MDEHIRRVNDDILFPFLKAKTQSTDDAREICSMVITKFWERFVVRGEEIPKNVNGYIYTMAHNAFINFSKVKDRMMKQHVELKTDRLNNIFVSDGDSMSTGGKQEEEKMYTALESAFAKLGEKCRKLIKMNVYEKKKIKDIHQELGIPTANAATKKKVSCINNLRKLMYQEIHHH